MELRSTLPKLRRSNRFLCRKISMMKISKISKLPWMGFKIARMFLWYKTSAGKQTHQNSDAFSRVPYPKAAEASQTDDYVISQETTEVTLIFPNDNQQQILKINDSLYEKEKQDYNVVDQNEQIKNEQQTFPYFKHIYKYLQDSTLPDDPKRAKPIPYETNQYELIHNILLHIFQPRSKKNIKTINNYKTNGISPIIEKWCVEVLSWFIRIWLLGVHRTCIAKKKYFWPMLHQNV